MIKKTKIESKFFYFNHNLDNENIIKNDSDLKNLNKISKILKITNSETIRLLIESKIKELNKQKNIFE